MNIHPTAIIDDSAQLADDVSVGPYSIIGADVSIGAGTEIAAHVVIKGPTRIGANNKIYQFNSLGEDPQDKKYAGEPTVLEIGDNNTIREYCTLNRGTVQDQGITRVGNDNWIMSYVHLAHDVVIGNNTILANCVQLAGHVEIGDHAILGGFAKSHQFCKVGEYAFMAYDAGLSHDVPPFVMVDGTPASPKGINSEGLRRNGFSQEDIRAIKRAYRILYRSKLRKEEAQVQLDELAKEHQVIQRFADFVRNSKRGVCR